MVHPYPNWNMETVKETHDKTAKESHGQEIIWRWSEGCPCYPQWHAWEKELRCI